MILGIYCWQSCFIYKIIKDVTVANLNRFELGKKFCDFSIKYDTVVRVLTILKNSIIIVKSHRIWLFFFQFLLANVHSVFDLLQTIFSDLRHQTLY